MSLYRFLLFTGLLCWPLPGVTQADYLNQEQGLQNTYVKSILKSKTTGFLWVGTEGGLYRYDGYRFVPVNEFSDKQHRQTLFINDLAEDKQGNIWMGTTQGLWKLNVHDNAIEHPGGEAAKVLGDNNVAALEFMQNGNLQVILKNRRVFEVDTALHITPFDDMLPQVTRWNWLFVSVNDRPGHVVHNLDSLYKNRVAKHLPDSLREEAVRMLNEDWIMIVKHGRWILKFNEITQQWEETGLCKKLNNAYYNPTAVTFSPDGRSVFIGFSDGKLVMVDLAGNSIVDLTSQVGHTAKNKVRCLEMDENNVLWVGTSRGVLKSKVSRSYFGHLLSAESHETAARNSIRGMALAAEPHLFAGSYSGLFEVVHGEMQQIIPHNRNPHSPISDLESGLMDTFFNPYGVLYCNDTLWVVSETRGLLVKYPRKSYVESVPKNEKWHWSFYHGYGICRSPVRNDVILMGTAGGLLSYHKTRHELTVIDSSSHVTFLKKLGNDVYAGTKRNGVYIYDRQGNYGPAQIDQALLARHYITGVDKRDNTLWVGTKGAGLYAFEMGKSTYSHYGLEEGLPSEFIASVTLDNKKNVWAATFNGLSRIDEETGKMCNYFEYDGLSENEFNINASLLSPDGTLFLGGLNGINHFQPEQVPFKSGELLKLYVSDISGTETEFNALHRTTPREITVALPYRHGPIALNFHLSDYTDPARNTFYYSLIDDHERDKLKTHERQVVLGKLTPGETLLRVTGQNADGIRSVNTVDIRFLVALPFYLHTWFIALCSFMTAALIAFFMVFRLRQKMKLQALRLRIASALHDEVGSILTRIGIRAQSLLYGNPGGPKQEELEKINTDSRLATLAMGDLLWNIDSRNDTFTNLIDRLREAGDEILSPAGIDFHLTTDRIQANREIAPLLRQQLYLIAKEALHNAAKHSGASTVTLSFNKTGHALVLKVSDNGAGLQNKSNNSNGQGIRNMKMRAEQANGKFELINRENGLTVKVTVPLK